MNFTSSSTAFHDIVKFDNVQGLNGHGSLAPALEDASWPMEVRGAGNGGVRLARVADFPAAVERPLRKAPEAPCLKELEIASETKSGIFWQYMTGYTRPSFTPELLHDLYAVRDYLCALAEHEGGSPFQYMVTASKVPGIYNLGGDLPRFVGLIREGDRDGLLTYALSCAEGQYLRAVNFDLPHTTISLVQGDTLGGGFECALADDVIIAEEHAKFGLPEVLFGLFPGMGAYSFLCRRVSPRRAEEMILSGRLYSAQELLELGVIDRVVASGTGEKAVYDFIDQDARRKRVRQVMHRLHREVNPVTRDELHRIAEIWVDTALTLGKGELRKMERLAQAQDKRLAALRNAD